MFKMHYIQRANLCADFSLFKKKSVVKLAALKKNGN